MAFQECNKFYETNGGEIWGPNGHLVTVEIGNMMTEDAVRVVQCIMRALDIEFGDNK